MQCKFSLNFSSYCIAVLKYLIIKACSKMLQALCNYLNNINEPFFDTGLLFSSKNSRNHT